MEAHGSAGGQAGVGVAGWQGGQRKSKCKAGQGVTPQTAAQLHKVLLLTTST